nr:immunoglobulin heavy chain junction region [Mus musculus]MBK4190123.1 immunoglobulin heavy chain junction region [Mus musculus]MBK4190124.1 immunoglobulin heavy chain junction region [Mus musculus]
CAAYGNYYFDYW